MTKILSYKNNRDKFLVIVLLIISIVITNSFIIFSPDEDSRFYFSGLTSTLALGVALVISIVMVYKYKRSIKKQEEKQHALSQQSNDTRLHHYYDNNKIHFSICLFFAFWLAASVNWTFELLYYIPPAPHLIEVLREVRRATLLRVPKNDMIIEGQDYLIRLFELKRSMAAEILL